MSYRISSTIFTLALGLSLPAAILAQSPTTGSAIRWRQGLTLYQGELAEVAPDGQLIVRLTDASTATVDPRTLFVEYRTGHRTKWGNAGVGLIVGAALGGFAGLASGDDECGPGSGWCILAYTAEEKGAMGGATGALVGAIIGAIVIPARRWAAVIPGDGSQVALHIAPGRVGLQLTF